MSEEVRFYLVPNLLHEIKKYLPKITKANLRTNIEKVAQIIEKILEESKIPHSRSALKRVIASIINKEPIEIQI